MDCTRSATRRLVFARISLFTTPAGRWVARIMCTPRVRPTAPTLTSELSTSGKSLASMANSSMTRSRRGMGSGGWVARYSVILSTPSPAAAKSRCRLSISASRLMRARFASCSSRLLMVPMVCGSRSQALKAAPPLKSMRMKFRRVGSLWVARPATRERRNSLLPEPVVPPTRPCGPSLTRSRVYTPWSPTPISVLYPLDFCQVLIIFWAVGGVPTPVISGRRTSEGRPAPGMTSSGSSNSASRWAR